jgi:hypothetical protein
MPYAEITIHRKKLQSDVSIFTRFFITRFFRWFGNEIFDKEDTIVILFDDNTIYDTNNLSYYGKITYTTTSTNMFPETITINNIYKLYKRNISNVVKESDITFNNYKNIINVDTSSIFNLFYSYKNNKNQTYPWNQFTIVRIKSAESNPRFLLAYNSDILDKNDILYLADLIFKYKL